MKGGNNCFSVATRPSFTVPVSSCTYSSAAPEEEGCYVLRAADGRAGKFTVSTDPSDGRRIIKYQIKK